MKQLSNLLVIFLFYLVACKPTNVNVQQQIQTKNGVEGKNGMVVTAHPLASKVGLTILQQGGNAFDAAIAVQFALAVVYPRAGNIGGGGFAVLRLNNGETLSLDFREKAPLAATRDMYLDKEQNPIPKLSQEGHLAVGVPGTVDGMIALHQKYGKLDWKTLLQPAIDLAQQGINLTEYEAEKFNTYQSEFKKWNPQGCTCIPKQQDTWKKNDKLTQLDLAATLQRIQTEQRNGFYKGRTAELLLQEIKDGKGILTQQDLDKYKAVWRKSIHQKVVLNDNSYNIISMPPPSSGGIALVQLLEGASQFDWAKYTHNSSQSIHILTELERRVYADRATYLGDPDFYNVPQQMLLDPTYIHQRNQTISLHKQTPSDSIKAGNVEIIESMETTHFSITDKDGNAISITTTLNGNYGSKVMVKGAGFFLNNEMDDFSIKAGFPNQFGLVGAEANAIQAQKRMLSSMTPTIVEITRNGKDELFMVVGTPGGSTIITSVFQTILNVSIFNMNMQQAVNAQKVHSQWLPDKIYYENLPDSIITNLHQLGHQTEQVERLGKMEAILVLPDGTYIGAADYLRGDDVAMGY